MRHFVLIATVFFLINSIDVYSQKKCNKLFKKYPEYYKESGYWNLFVKPKLGATGYTNDEKTVIHKKLTTQLSDSVNQFHYDYINMVKCFCLEGNKYRKTFQGALHQIYIDMYVQTIIATAVKNNKESKELKDAVLTLIEEVIHTNDDCLQSSIENIKQYVTEEDLKKRINILEKRKCKTKKS